MTGTHPAVPARQSLTVDEPFDYVIKRQRRKTIAVHILADASVEVRAPKWVPRYELVQFVEQRAEWIIAQRRKTLAKQSQVPRYRHGETHCFLGRHYPLNVAQNTRRRVDFIDSAASADTAHWFIQVPEVNDAVVVQRALERWYRQQASTVFAAQLRVCFARFPAWFQARYTLPDLTIRKMRRRWGSCSSKGLVTLNLLLIKLPIDCIDYVIIHELCHLNAFHHGPAFYQLLGAVLPDWREREAIIDQLSCG